MPDRTEHLSNYINGGCLSRSDRILSAVWSGLPFYRNARQVMQENNDRRSRPAGEEVLRLEIEPYSRRHPQVLEMQEYLRHHLEESLAEAVVHGSLGTGEEMAYSDFDALVVLRDVVFDSSSLLVYTARRLHAARSIMYRMDPLQHHGWFVLAESHLKQYPVTYFPPELFAWSRSLLYAGGRSLDIRVSPGHDFVSPCRRLCRSLEKK